MLHPPLHCISPQKAKVQCQNWEVSSGLSLTRQYQPSWERPQQALMQQQQDLQAKRQSVRWRPEFVAYDESRVGGGLVVCLFVCVASWLLARIFAQRCRTQVNALNMSLQYLPRAADADCRNPYVPQNPMPAGAQHRLCEHFPSSPSGVFDNPVSFATGPLSSLPWCLVYLPYVLYCFICFGTQQASTRHD